LNFGWPNADFKERNEKRGGRKKSHRRRTTMNCIIRTTPFVVPPLDTSKDTIIEPFWSSEDVARASQFIFLFLFYLLKDWFAPNSNRL
jgi:hypothetical protein